jgi:hypothetical protein
MSAANKIRKSDYRFAFLQKEKRGGIQTDRTYWTKNYSYTDYTKKGIAVPVENQAPVARPKGSFPMSSRFIVVS